MTTTNKTTKKQYFEPYYGIKIADVDVTEKNCKDLSVIDGVDGKMYLFLFICI